MSRRRFCSGRFVSVGCKVTGLASSTVCIALTMLCQSMPVPRPSRLMVDEVASEDAEDVVGTRDTVFSFGVANLQSARGNCPAEGSDLELFLK